MSSLGLAVLILGTNCPFEDVDVADAHGEPVALVLLHGDEVQAAQLEIVLSKLKIDQYIRLLKN